MWQLGPSGKMEDKLSFKGYRSGQMMYLRIEDLKRQMKISGILSKNLCQKKGILQN
jgi:hypothetical protein